MSRIENAYPRLLHYARCIFTQVPRLRCSPTGPRLAAIGLLRLAVSVETPIRWLHLTPKGARCTDLPFHALAVALPRAWVY